MEQIALSISEIFGWSVGVSAIVAVAISALWAIYFNRIKEGQKAEFKKQLNEQQANFDKQLETLKAKNDKCNYISKTQFDAEFKIYQELSEAGFNMLLDNSRLFPMKIDRLPENKEEQQKVFEERFDTANKSLILYQNMLFKFAPFIQENIYLTFNEFKELGRLQLIYYPILKFENDPDVRKDLLKDEQECWKRTHKMFKLHEKLINELREYLKSLKIQED